MLVPSISAVVSSLLLLSTVAPVQGAWSHGSGVGRRRHHARGPKRGSFWNSVTGNVEKQMAIERDLAERKLPITATTTVVVDATSTQTIWELFTATPSASATAGDLNTTVVTSASATAGAPLESSSSASDVADATGSSTAAPSVSSSSDAPSASESASASASEAGGLNATTSGDAPRPTAFSSLIETNGASSLSKTYTASFTVSDVGVTTVVGGPVPTSTASEAASTAPAESSASVSSSANSTASDSATASASTTASFSGGVNNTLPSITISLSSDAAASSTAMDGSSSAVETSSIARNTSSLPSPNGVPSYTRTQSITSSAIPTDSVGMDSSSSAAASSSVARNTSSLPPPNGVPSYTRTQSVASSAMPTESSVSSSASEPLSASSSEASASASISTSLSSSTPLTASVTASVSASETASSTIVETVSSSSAAQTASISAVTASTTASVTLSSSIIASVSSTSSSAPAATSTASSGSVGRTTRSLNSQLMAAYFPDWTVGTMPPSAVDWSLFDCLDFAFALPDANFNLVFTMWNSEASLTSLVQLGHAAGKMVRLSIGGWTGSVYFSSAVSTAENRQLFANNILAVYNQFNLDGIDIDWEYPGNGNGASGNGWSPNDSDNLLLFFQTLRATLPSDAVISAATQIWPFTASNSAPMTDVSGFAEVLDWVLLMNYDVWGSASGGSLPGPNAPLDNHCGNSAQPSANALAAITSWTAANMGADQIMLGVPAYGYLQLSTSTTLRHRKRDAVTLLNPNGGNSYGQVDFSSAVSQGALVKDSDGNFVGGGGFTRIWDDCSSTPFLSSPYSGQVYTYDDTQSLSMKGALARQMGIRGCNMWEIAGDTASFDLTRAIRSGLGI